MELTRLINNNVSSTIIGSNITEYDLKRAHPTVLALLFPNDPLFTSLGSLPKSEYTVKIGNLIKENPTLRKQIDTKVLELFNRFLKANNISEMNFLGSTPDSLLIANQLASVTTFDRIANFRCKEGISYTSLFYISKTEYILFDRVTKRLRIKGIGQEEETNKYEFVRTILKKICCIIDDSNNVDRIETLRRLKQIRLLYLTSNNIEIYRDIKNKNMLKYCVDGRAIFSEIPLTENENCILDKSCNYVNFILPLIQMCI
jgi:hypothetical protein